MRQSLCIGLGVVWSLGTLGAWMACTERPTTAIITAQEFRFSPRMVRLPARSEVRIILRNRGHERHQFQSRILRFARAEGKMAFEIPRGPGEGLSLEPGQQLSLSLAAPPGVYAFRCRVRGHAGMEGLLMVNETS